MQKYFETNANNQLIHFTDSIEKILSILTTNSLRLKYCKEQFRVTKTNIISKNVHPMVCFSEQDITLLEHKKISYGRYGIAFKSDWIIKNNIQPVIYVEENSPIAISLAKLLVYRKELVKGDPLRLPIITIKAYLKNTIGYNEYLKQDDFLFKDENEWRFVPEKKQIGNGYISENRSTFSKHKVKYQNLLINFPLKFDRDKDIICVYCANNKDVELLRSYSLIEPTKILLAEWQ